MCDMDSQRVLELVKKSLNGTISPVEQEMLANWYNTIGKNEAVVIPADQAENEEKLKIKIWLDIASAAQLSVASERPTPVVEIHDQELQKYRLRKIWFRYAAAIIVLIGTAIAFVVSSNRQLDKSKSVLVKSNIHPGKETAVLTLADGRTITLDSAVNGTLAYQANASIIKLSNGQIMYNLKESLNGPIAMNTMSTPKGGKYQVILSDGTKAWLNAASSITYPSAFTAKTRSVRISGEVYLEVAKNEQKPFVVDVNGQQLIKVLGTSFNVNSYSNESDIKTTLIDGSVKVENSGNIIFLKPGQQAVLAQQKEKNSVFKVVSDVNTVQALAWKNGIFDFDRVDIKSVMRKIERWYNVEVVYEGDMIAETLVGELPMNASIDRVLNILEKIGIHFRIEGNKIIVRK
jgi:transmembrane sensor